VSAVTVVTHDDALVAAERELASRADERRLICVMLRACAKDREALGWREIAGAYWSAIGNIEAMTHHEEES